MQTSTQNDQFRATQLKIITQPAAAAIGGCVRAAVQSIGNAM
jgi:hypothetical protein